MAFWLYLVAFILSFLSVVYHYYTSTFKYWKNKGVPYLEPTPFFGNVKEMILFSKSPPEVMQDLYNRLKGHRFGGIFQSRIPTLLLRDPEIIKIMLVKDFQHFAYRGIRIDEKNDPLAGNLFNLEGNRWRHLRVKLTPVFTSGKMKMMFSLVCKCAEDLAKSLEDLSDSRIEIKNVMINYTTEVIGACAFGLQIDSLKDPDSIFRKMGKKLFFPPGAILRKPLRLLLPQLKFRLYRDDVTEFFCSLVRDTMAYRKVNGIKRNDFMQLMMQLRDKGHVEEEDDDDQTDSPTQQVLQPPSDTELTVVQIAAQAMVFFLAGFETSSTTMSFCLHELAMNPDVQDRVRGEIDTVLERFSAVTYEAIREMEYLDHVVAETLRKYPPLSNLTRECTKAYTVPETSVEIDEGTPVLIPVYAIQHDPKHYPDPERFDPDRFSEAGKNSRHAFTYLPFGEGPRNCIGMRFGLMQTKVGLTTLLSKYEFSPCERTVHPLVFNPKTFITSTREGIWLQVRRRSD